MSSLRLSIFPALALAACTATNEGPGTGLGADAGHPEDAGTIAYDAGPDIVLDAGSTAAVRPNFHEDIEPLLQRRCQTCHRPDGVAPFSLLTYADARPRAPLLMQETAAKRMPPWAALPTEECQPQKPFRDDQHLTEQEIALFADWFGAGTPEGDPAKAPPPKTFGTNYGELSRVDATFQPEEPFSVMGPRDQFRCFVIDPQWSDDQWVTGVRFVPGNPAVVHHAITYLDPEGSSRALAGPDGSYECFAGPRFSNTSILNAWAPGAGGGELDPGAAMTVTRGSLIVLQVHYHSLGHDGETDHSKLEIQLGDVRPTWLMQILLIGNFDSLDADGDGLQPGMDDRGATPEFVIPAGAKGHVEDMRFTLPQEIAPGVPVPTLKVMSVGTHMHYVGTDMKFDIEHAAPKTGEPARECMIQTPVWSFQWQRGYAYDTDFDHAPEWRPGDRLWMRCKYDNTMDNRYVAQALREQGLSAPREVRLGEETLDEMCLAVLAIAYRNPF